MKKEYKGHVLCVCVDDVLLAVNVLIMIMMNIGLKQEEKKVVFRFGLKKMMFHVLKCFNSN